MMFKGKSKKKPRKSQDKAKKKKVHFGALMELCHIKHSELQAWLQRYKGRIVFRGDNVKDEEGSFAVFSEQGTSASLMSAAKFSDAIARMPGCDGEDSDAVGAYTQITWEMATELLGLDVIPETWVSIPKHRRPKYWEGIDNCINKLDVPVFQPGVKVPQLQKLCYASLLSAAMQANIPATIDKRIRDTFSPFDIPHFDYPDIAVQLRQLRKHDAMRVIKTWVNSWATSYRLHEPVLLPCLFGCVNASDQTNTEEAQVHANGMK